MSVEMGTNSVKWTLCPVDAWSVADYSFPASAMLRREFVSTLEKQLKNMKISRNTSIAITPTNRSNLVACPGGRVAMTTTLSRSNEPPGVCVEDRTAHDVTCATPADIVIQFKVSDYRHRRPSWITVSGGHLVSLSVTAILSHCMRDNMIKLKQGIFILSYMQPTTISQY